MKNYLPPLIMMGLIFISSSIPMEGERVHFKVVTELTPTIQDLLHIPLFGVLAYLWMSSFTRHGLSTPKKLIFTIIITTFYGFFDEFHQSFVPGRYASLSDIVLDIAGITTGTVVYLQREKVNRRQ